MWSVSSREDSLKIVRNGTVSSRRDSLKIVRNVECFVAWGFPEDHAECGVFRQVNFCNHF